MIPLFDVNEVFDKAKQHKVPPFYLIYGWLIFNGFGNDESTDDIIRSLADSRLGLNITILRFIVSQDRKRNARIIKMFESIPDITLSFEGKDAWITNDYYWSTDEKKYGKYINYEDPYC